MKKILLSILILPAAAYCAVKADFDKLVILKQVKQKFISGLKGDYKTNKKYQNPEVRIYPNPKNHNEKIIYIEPEKNWWGFLYFATFNGSKLNEWKQIETYGAITTFVEWRNNGFFYKDSTHSGTKTENFCHVKNGSFKCVRTKEPYR